MFRPIVDIEIICDSDIGLVDAKYSLFICNLQKRGTDHGEKRVFRQGYYNNQAIDNIFNSEDEIKHHFMNLIDRLPTNGKYNDSQVISSLQIMSRIAKDFLFLNQIDDIPVDNLISISCWSGKDRTGMFITRLKFDIWKHLEAHKILDFEFGEKRNAFLNSTLKPSGVLFTLLQENNQSFPKVSFNLWKGLGRSKRKSFTDIVKNLCA